MLQQKVDKTRQELHQFQPARLMRCSIRLMALVCTLQGHQVVPVYQAGIANVVTPAPTDSASQAQAS